MSVTVRRAAPGLALGLALGLLALGPGLRRGFLLSYDMVFVPREPFTSTMFGLSGGPPRAVPSDFVIAVASRVLPADLIQKLVLLLIFVLACSGATALLRREPLLARLAAGVCYAWNPYVAERLIIGQWALLLGYAGLPWVLRAVIDPGLASRRGTTRLALALLPAVTGGFAAITITALPAIPAAFSPSPRQSPPAPLPPAPSAPPAPLPPAPSAPPAPRPPAPSAPPVPPPPTPAAPAPAAPPVPRVPAPTGQPARRPPAPIAPPAPRTRRAVVALTALAVGSLPWLVPSVLHTVYADPAGVAAFAARADTPFGTLGSLLMLGGMWNADTVPKAYGGAWSGPWLAVVLAAIVSYAVLARRRWPGLGPAALVGLLLASIGVTAPGRDLLRAAIGLWPGFAILRDAQQFVAPLALVEALGLGLAVSWAMHPRSFGIKKEGHPTTAGQNPSRTGEMPGFPWKIRVWWKKRWTIVHQMFRGTRIFQDLSGIWRSRTAGRSFPGRIRACGRFWSTTVHRILPGTRILPDPPAAHRAVAPTRTTAPTSTSTRPSPAASTSTGTSPGPTTSPAPGTGTGTGTSSPSPDRLGLAIGIAALLAPVLLLPGLAWGAAGRLRPAAYPQNYLAAARMIDSSRAPGAVLLLPWAAYRTLPWNHDEPVLDPWPRLLSRPVIWNDGTQVGPLKMTPDYQAAEDLDSKITSNEPLTSTLQKAGIRFVVVDSGPTQAQRLPGCATVFIRPGLAVYEVPPE